MLEAGLSDSRNLLDLDEMARRDEQDTGLAHLFQGSLECSAAKSESWQSRRRKGFVGGHWLCVS